VASRLSEPSGIVGLVGPLCLPGTRRRRGPHTPGGGKGPAPGSAWARRRTRKRALGLAVRPVVRSGGGFRRGKPAGGRASARAR
jgi:hypothetical protein